MQGAYVLYLLYINCFIKGACVLYLLYINCFIQGACVLYLPYFNCFIQGAYVIYLLYISCFIQGAYVGDAAGIKITSLLKLSELRSNKPRVNLLHVVVMQAESYKPILLQFFDGMKYLKNTAELVP